ncbi:MAG: gfo/Idh/MocA family oxidoreductase, partial [Candidatus Solibacter usitatus]|nr:gfo/Idh/MocA family oxidoreductase [Candidatus Solibacter usitatus]
HVSRFVFGEEPVRAIGVMESDPQMGTDRLTSVILEYPSGQCIFTCSTQMVPYQRAHFHGTKGRVELEIPFNAAPDRPARIFIDDGGDLFGASISVEEFPACDQYTLQGEAFSRSIREGSPVPVSLEDSLNNMRVIEAITRSVSSGKWEQV